MVEVSELHACGMMRMIINRRFYFSNGYGQCSIENIIFGSFKNINTRTVFCEGRMNNNNNK